jgi:hypothetical protein
VDAKTGRKYYGQWGEKGLEGFGGYSSPSEPGALLVCNFVEGVPHGEGAIYYSEGGIYVGEWNMGSLVGLGYKISEDGSVEVVPWVEHDQAISAEEEKRE